MIHLVPAAGYHQHGSVGQGLDAAHAWSRFSPLVYTFPQAAPPLPFGTHTHRWDFSSGKSLERWSVNQVCPCACGLSEHLDFCVHLVAGGPVTQSNVSLRALNPATPSQVAESTSENQLFNPPLVHALAVPATSSSCRPWSQLVAVARGDGTVQVWDADAPAPKPSPGSSGAGGSGGGKSGKKGGSKGGAKQAAPSAAAPAAAGAPAGQEAEHSAQGTEAGSESQGTQGAGSSSSSSSPSIPSLPPGTWLGPRELGRAQGGHTRPASSLAFAWLEPAGASVAAAGSSGSKAAGGSQGGPTHLVSGGEDRRILVWRLRAPLAHADAPLEATGAARATGEGAGSVTEPAGVSSQEGPTGTAEAAPWSELALDFKHGRKVNQLCVGSWQGGPSLLFVADTSKLLSCYRMDATSFNGGWL